ncbi:NTP transferase domain-containing protein [Blastomonas sp.]|uniref:molybdenum cofactor guanylyltransferase n=1 Tax=Blastomonas sp. TaxID=1909299 RepID=UPI002625709B|nr:NTP transferase domain-containing protein [Blastomonas sp.]MDM7957271.1 NTP transferase domain-containing protein [Blastomonas sp.]
MTAIAMPVAVVLAGGRSRRMQGPDKALAMIAGERMIDRVLRRMRPQVAELLLSAPQDYGTGCTAIPDLSDGPAGPMGAIRAVAHALCVRGIEAFVTVPVDAPFVPLDLVDRLTASGPMAMARTQDGWQPVFALWQGPAVLAALTPARCSEKWSLRRLAQELGAAAVDFDGGQALMNVNTPEDLALAQQIAARDACPEQQP